MAPLRLGPYQSKHQSYTKLASPLLNILCYYMFYSSTIIMTSLVNNFWEATLQPLYIISVVFLPLNRLLLIVIGMFGLLGIDTVFCSPYLVFLYSLSILYLSISLAFALSDSHTMFMCNTHQRQSSICQVVLDSIFGVYKLYSATNLLHNIDARPLFMLLESCNLNLGYGGTR